MCGTPPGLPSSVGHVQCSVPNKACSPSSSSSCFCSLHTGAQQQQAGGGSWVRTGCRLHTSCPADSSSRGSVSAVSATKAESVAMALRKHSFPRWKVCRSGDLTRRLGTLGQEQNVVLLRGTHGRLRAPCPAIPRASFCSGTSFISRAFRPVRASPSPSTAALLSVLGTSMCKPGRRWGSRGKWPLRPPVSPVSIPL